RGVPREFAVHLEARSRPLVAAAFGRQAVTFAERRGERRPSPLGRVPIVAQPMYARMGRENVPAGLLIVSPPESNHGLLAWMGSVLASPLVRLGRSRSLTE